MHDIDGSFGEGGGQLVRTACALAAITGEALRLHNIRARRAPPGLAPQHLTAVRAVASLCNAEVEGLELRTQEIVFRPRQVRAGAYRFDVGTAGSIALVLQAVLPVALAADGESSIRVTGGTDVRAAPAIDYLCHVLVPLLARMGARIELEVQRRGYYPRGGGVVVVRVAPARLRALRLDAPGAVHRIAGIAHASNLPAHIVERMQRTACERLSRYGPIAIDQQVLSGEAAVGQGGAIALWAQTENSRLGTSQVAQRGVPAEHIAASAAEALKEELVAGATLDIHASDQLLIYMARADGPSQFLVRRLSSHAETTLWLLQQFLPLRVTTAAAGNLVRVDIEPRGS
jgi:RNA 3'-terminal phosphate cyclase (ATP)/RNA 3'-terminal phosphate cyclase (GTP)